MNWYLRVLRKYAVFSGRARRREYWWFTVIHLVIFFALMLIDFQRMGLFDASLEEMQQLAEERAGQIGFSGFYGYAVLLPLLAVQVRRLHDSGRSGWWMILPLGPQLVIWAIVLFTQHQLDPAAQNPFAGVNLVLTLLSLVMFCGGLVLLVMMCLDGSVGPNRYGADPKGRGGPALDEVWPEVG